MAQQLTLHTAQEVVAWLRERAHAQSHMTADSRKLQAGDVFLAYPGYARDGREFVSAALSGGAVACVVESQDAERFALDERTLCVPDLKSLAGEIASQFYGVPSASLDVIAVTGTNGKTTVTNWIAQSLDKINIPCAVIGTLGMIYVSDVHDTGMTTPDPVALQRFLRHVVDAGAKAVAMEASSIGIEEGRINGTHIRCAVFTNLTQDHLDYHGDMSAYARSKRGLFDRVRWQGLKQVVLNVADATGKQWADELCTDSALQVSRFAGQARNDWKATNAMAQSEGISFEISQGGQSENVHAHFIGQHNIENFLATVAVVREYASSFEVAVRACETVRAVSGRLELIATEGAPLAVVDYAHTPDALEKALSALRPTADQRQGELWAVFGCGGDRDRTKRPLMAAAAERGADAVVVTSDNPRTESADLILADIAKGLTKPARMIEVDRRAAIAQTVARAKQQDVILIAGKGHEDYQIVGAVKHPFSDQAEARVAQQAYATKHARGLAA